MNGTQKYLVHLEMVIWESVPEGTRLNAQQVIELMAKATPDQKQAAMVRGVDHVPLILPEDEIDLGSEHNSSKGNAVREDCETCQRYGECVCLVEC